MGEKFKNLDKKLVREALIYSMYRKQPIFDIFAGVEIGISGGSVVRDIYKFFHKTDFSCPDSNSQDIDIYVDKKQKDNIKKLMLDNKEIVLNGDAYDSNVKYFYKGIKLDIIFIDTDKIKLNAVIGKFDMIHCAIMLQRNMANILRVASSSFSYNSNCRNAYLLSALNSIYNKDIVFNCIGLPNATISRISKYSRRGFFLRRYESDLFVTLIEKLNKLRKQKFEEINTANCSNFDLSTKDCPTSSSSNFEGVEVTSGTNFVIEAYVIDNFELKDFSELSNEPFRFIDI